MDQPVQRISHFHLTGSLHAGQKVDIYSGEFVQEGKSVHVAVKVLKSQLACVGGELREFLDEVGWATDLGYSIFPRVYEAGEHGGHYFLAMELVEGWSLTTVLSALARRKLPLSCEAGLSIAQQIASGVHALHEHREDRQLLGVVHLGLNPDNIMVGRNGGAKVLDFGNTTAAVDRERVRCDGKDAEFQAPEYQRGLPVDRRADTYSLGCILRKMVGYMAKEAVGDDLPALLDRACNANPEQRFTSMSDFKIALDLIGQNRGFAPSPSACKRFTETLFGRRPASPPPIPAQQETAFSSPESQPNAPILTPTGEKTAVASPSEKATAIASSDSGLSELDVPTQERDAKARNLKETAFVDSENAPTQKERDSNSKDLKDTAFRPPSSRPITEEPTAVGAPDAQEIAVRSDASERAATLEETAFRPADVASLGSAAAQEAVFSKAGTDGNDELTAFGSAPLPPKVEAPVPLVGAEEEVTAVGGPEDELIAAKVAQASSLGSVGNEEVTAVAEPVPAPKAKFVDAHLLVTVKGGPPEPNSAKQLAEAPALKKATGKTFANTSPKEPKASTEEEVTALGEVPPKEPSKPKKKFLEEMIPTKTYDQHNRDEET